MLNLPFSRCLMDNFSLTSNIPRSLCIAIPTTCSAQMWIGYLLMYRVALCSEVSSSCCLALLIVNWGSVVSAVTACGSSPGTIRVTLVGSASLLSLPRWLSMVLAGAKPDVGTMAAVMAAPNTMVPIITVIIIPG